MSTLITISRAIVAVVGAIALLLAAGNLATGGGSIADPVFPLGLLFGVATLGAAIWTTDPQRWRAVVVWPASSPSARCSSRSVQHGDAALRDVLVYFGIPATIVLAAAVLVAVTRVRAGALGGPQV